MTKLRSFSLGLLHKNENNIGHQTQAKNRSDERQVLVRMLCISLEMTRHDGRLREI